MRVVGIIQARYNSTRLPGKVTKLLAGLPIVWHLYRRLLKCRELDEVVVAVGSENPEPILDVCDKYGMRWRVGEEKNLLSRILDVAMWARADAVVRTTCDCVFHDPVLIDRLVSLFVERWPSTRAVANWPKRYVSEGLDAEVYGMEALLALDRDPLCPREDFATYAIKAGISCQTGLAPLGGVNLHLSIDTEQDLQKAERVMTAIGVDNFSYEAVVRELA